MRWNDLIGTLNSYFQLGISGPRLKNNGGVVEAKNAADNAYTPVRGSIVQATADEVEFNADAAGAGADWSYKLKRPAAGQAGAVVLTLPVDDGSPAQVLATDGSGNLSWSTVAAGTDKVVTDTTTLAFGDASPKAMFTLPSGAVITAVRVVVDTPFNGAPSLSVGITGTTSKYMSSTQVDLTADAKTVFEVEPGEPAPGGAENLIATYAAGGATAGSARILVDYVIPS